MTKCEQLYINLLNMVNNDITLESSKIDLVIVGETVNSLNAVIKDINNKINTNKKAYLHNIITGKVYTEKVQKLYTMLNIAEYRLNICKEHRQLVNKQNKEFSKQLEAMLHD